MNNPKFKILFFLGCAAVGLIPAGCTRHPAPPIERNELVLRFFKSMQNNQPAAAAEQGAKLKALDPANEFVNRLVMIQQSNAFILEAQLALREQNPDAALAALNRGLRQYPGNRNLLLARGRVRQARLAQRLLAGMATARTAAAMSSALTAAATGLSSNLTPELTAYFNRYRQQLAQKLEEEKRHNNEPLPISSAQFD